MTINTENTYEWESRFADLTSTVTGGTYTQPQDTFDDFDSDGDVGDLVEEDHDRPPLGTFVFGPAYDGTCFIIKDNLLHYCKPKQPEYWPALYYIEASTPIFPGVTGVFHNGQPYYITAVEIFYIQGTGHGTFLPLPMKAKCGAQSKQGAISVLGKGIFHTGPDGIYQFGSGQDVKITEDALEPIFRGETVNGLPGVVSMSTSKLWVYRNHLYFAYAGEGDEYPSNVLIMNLDNGRLAYYAYGAEIRAIQFDSTNNRLIVGDNAGIVKIIESPLYTDDSGTAISFEIQSKDFWLQTRKHFPRHVKYDIDASDAVSCIGKLLLDGEVHQSHTITGDRDTKRRLVAIGNGNTAAIRISGSGPVSIYSVEFE